MVPSPWRGFIANHYHLFFNRGTPSACFNLQYWIAAIKEAAINVSRLTDSPQAYHGNTNRQDGARYVAFFDRKAISHKPGAERLEIVAWSYVRDPAMRDNGGMPDGTFGKAARRRDRALNTNVLGSSRILSVRHRPSGSQR